MHTACAVEAAAGRRAKDLPKNIDRNPSYDPDSKDGKRLATLEAQRPGVR